VQQLQVTGEQQVVFEFAGGTHCYAEEPSELSVAALPQASAIFAVTEEAARRIWPVSPYNSSLGNVAVAP
jgi:hypothetical protein